MESISQLLSKVPNYGALPEVLRDFLPMLVSCVIILLYVAILAMFFIWLERKVSAHMQDRLGPMYVGGWHGWAQSIADGIKLLLKEDIIPGAADPFLFKVAPIVVFVGSFAAFVVLPFGASSIVADLNIGILYLVAVGSLGVVGILMAGWASNNKYALYGGMRSAAQIVSYEIPAAIAIMTVVVVTESLSMQDIVKAQAGGIHKWFIFRNPFTFFAFFVYFTCSLAEVNRTPFDIPEAESELVAGYHTEYSGMRFAFFFLAEYASMFVVSGIAAALFLGGWQPALPPALLGHPILWVLFTVFSLVWLGWITASLLLKILPYERLRMLHLFLVAAILVAPKTGPIIFSLKAIFLVFVQMWLRWSLPRLRVDQLMYMCWKVMLPVSFVLLLGVGFWELMFKS